MNNSQGANNDNWSIIRNLISTFLNNQSYCYESPKQEKVSHTFEHLIQNLKAYNGVRI